MTPIAAGNRVSYRRAGLTEWYRNGPFGIEQGFTVAGRLPDAGRSLTVAIHVSGTLQLSQQGSQILFSRPRGGPVALRYGGLNAIDAAGRSLPSQLRLEGRTLLLRVDDANATFPVTIDPLIQQGSKLTGGEDGRFGLSAALSADGNTALVGAPTDGEDVGSASVYTRSGSTWTVQAVLDTTVSGDESGPAQFGASVALSADGNTALLGGPGDALANGAAWVFTRSGSTWTEQQKLTVSDETSDGQFGGSAALSADGNTALIGGSGDGSGAGAAWVFTRSAAAWAEQQKLLPSDEYASGQFGASAALSSDGNTALIGGPQDNGDVGAAWVFTRSAGSWAQQGGKLVGSDETWTRAARPPERGPLRGWKHGAGFGLSGDNSRKRGGRGCTRARARRGASRARSS